jgi:CubicO group peptidase (beta-lactamase class C family)
MRTFIIINNHNKQYKRMEENSMKNIIIICLIGSILFFAGSVEGVGEILELEQTSKQTPESPAYWPTEDWQSSTPERQGMNSEQLAEALDFLQEQDDFNIHSLLIIRNGYIVTDAYFEPFTQGSVHDTASVTKSFTATLVGIAIDKGYIESVHQPVLDFFPERTVANVDTNKEKMTVEHLLTMRSGLECINQPTEVTLFRMMESPDWIQFTLDLPVKEEPGTRFVYCSSNVHLLSTIISKTTGMNALAFAREHLFEPLGISNVSWPSDPEGNNHGWGDLRMTPHDMAKLGYLYLNEGWWDGRKVLSPAWVTAATSVPENASVVNYGYLWWLVPEYPDVYYADGRGGQRIFVLPDQDMVVVTTGGGGRDQYRVLETLLTSYILPAAESETPLPANPEGVALLESKIQQVAIAQAESEPVPPLPEIAGRVSGQTYVLDANQLGLQSLSLTFQEEEEGLLNLTFIDGNQVEYLVGLDNVFRISPGRFGLPAAAKGWWASENVYVIHIDEIGNINQWRINATFEDDQVTVQMQDLTGLGSVTLVGQLERTLPPTPAFVAIFAIAGISVIVWLLRRRK